MQHNLFSHILYPCFASCGIPLSHKKQKTWEGCRFIVVGARGCRALLGTVLMAHLDIFFITETSLVRDVAVTTTGDAASAKRRGCSCCGGAIIFFLVRVPGGSPWDGVVGVEDNRRRKRQGRGMDNSYVRGNPSLGCDCPRRWRVSERAGGVAEKREEASHGVGDGLSVEDALAVHVEGPEEQPARGRRSVLFFSLLSPIGYVYFPVFSAVHIVVQRLSSATIGITVAP